MVLITVETFEDEKVLYVFMDAGEDFLHLSADGDFAFSEEILLTIRSMQQLYSGSYIFL